MYPKVYVSQAELSSLTVLIEESPRGGLQYLVTEGSQMRVCGRFETLDEALELYCYRMLSRSMNLTQEIQDLLARRLEED